VVEDIFNVNSEEDDRIESEMSLRYHQGLAIVGNHGYRNFHSNLVMLTRPMRELDLENSLAEVKDQIDKSNYVKLGDKVNVLIPFNLSRTHWIAKILTLKKTSTEATMLTVDQANPIIPASESTEMEKSRYKFTHLDPTELYVKQ